MARKAKPLTRDEKIKAAVIAARAAIAELEKLIAESVPPARKATKVKRAKATKVKRAPAKKLKRKTAKKAARKTANKVARKGVKKAAKKTGRARKGPKLYQQAAAASTLARDAAKLTGKLGYVNGKAA